MAKTARLVALSSAMLLLCVPLGCARLEPSRLARSPPAAGQHSIFVIAHRYHTGLVVRAVDVPREAWPARVDMPNADYLELGWGDREYYPLENPGVSLALRALFLPSPSAIEVVPITGPLASAGRGGEIVELRVTRVGFERMVAFVRQSHELDAQERGVIIASSPQGALFYASPRTFHGVENCNVWVARTLQAAELPVRPALAITAGLLLQQVRRLSDAIEPQGTVP